MKTKVIRLIVVLLLLLNSNSSALKDGEIQKFVGFQNGDSYSYAIQKWEKLEIDGLYNRSLERTELVVEVISVPLWEETNYPFPGQSGLLTPFGMDNISFIEIRETYFNEVIVERNQSLTNWGNYFLFVDWEYFTLELNATILNNNLQDNATIINNDDIFGYELDYRVEIRGWNTSIYIRQEYDKTFGILGFSDYLYNESKFDPLTNHTITRDFFHYAFKQFGFGKPELLPFAYPTVWFALIIATTIIRRKRSN